MKSSLYFCLLPHTKKKNSIWKQMSLYSILLPPRWDKYRRSNVITYNSVTTWCLSLLHLTSVNSYNSTNKTECTPHVSSKTYLRMLGTNSSCSTIRTSENNWHWYLTSRHVIGFCGRINNMVDCLQISTSKVICLDSRTSAINNPKVMIILQILYKKWFSTCSDLTRIHANICRQKWHCHMLF